MYNDKIQRYFTIAINGQSAVDAGYKFQGRNCYRDIITHGAKIAQLEVVIDDDGDYNGIPQKWVDVSWIKTGADVQRALRALAKIGFAGCPCVVSACELTGCIEDSTELFCCII